MTEGMNLLRDSSGTDGTFDNAPRCLQKVAFLSWPIRIEIAAILHNKLHYIRPSSLLMGSIGLNHGPPPNSVFGSSLCLSPSGIPLGELVLHTSPSGLLWAASSSEPLRVPLEGGTGDVILRLP